jgi:hypothetical protein
MSTNTKRMQVPRLRELYSYDKLTGYVKNIRLDRRVMPDHAGFVMLFEPNTKHAQKFKLTKLCYSLETGIDCKKEDRVIQKDLNEDNYKFDNLRLMSKEEYAVYKNAFRNINGGICLKIYPLDVYSYKLYWYEDGKQCSRIVGDIVTARREEIKMKLKYTKILSRFCVSE